MCLKGGRALTAEQQDIVMSHDSRATDPCRASLNGEGKEGEPSLMVVTAFAGTGKTTTLRAYAEARPDRKYVRLSYFQHHDSPCGRQSSLDLGGSV